MPLKRVANIIYLLCVIGTPGRFYYGKVNDMERETVLVLDFGGQYNQLIARCVRECNVYAEVHPYTMTLDEIRAMDPKGIIFTGDRKSVV